MGKTLLRAAGGCSVALVVSIAACSSDEEPAPVTPGIAKPTGHPALTFDEIETQLLEGVEDESVPMTEADLDKYFPVVEQLTEPEKWADRDPTKGDQSDVEKTFNAFSPTENPDDHFTIDVIETGVTAADIARAKKGLLFGMANWDGFRVHPGFNLTAATKASAGGRPFKVSIKTTPDPSPSVGWRAYVQPCGGAPAPTGTMPELIASVANDTCVPRIVLPLETGKALESLNTFVFNHEVGHIAQAYWQHSQPYLAAGGVKQAAAIFAEQNWSLEADAQFVTRHAPEAYAYNGYFPDKTCPFEPLRRGAYAWKNFSGTAGAREDQLLGYQMGIFVDQVTWHRFGKDPKWLYEWLTAESDARMPGKPVTPTRRLLKLVSKDGTTTDLKAINGVLLQAGADLYFSGKVPWTTRQLDHACVRPSATVDLPLLSIDAVRVDLGDLSKVAKIRLSLEASRDRDFLRAGVAAVKLDDAGQPKFIDCLQQQISEGALSQAEPRAACKQEATGLAVLTPKNDYTDEVQLPITFQSADKYAIIAIVAHTMKRKDAPDTPIKVTLHAEPVATPPGNQVAKEQCGALTEEYRSHCKTSNCFCIGNAYCEATVDPPPASCEKMQQECYAFCIFQKDECDCASFCDLLYTRLACH
jgi:hypothetical protein